MKENSGKIVLRPKHVRILKLCFACFFLWGLLIMITVPVSGETDGMGSSVEGIVGIGIPWLLLSVSIAWDLLGVRVTLLPGGKISYRRIGVERTDSDGDPAERFQRRRSQNTIQIGFGIKHDTITPVVAWIRRNWQFVNIDEEIDSWEVEKVGYTQKIFKKRVYTGKQIKNSEQYISLILKNGRCLDLWLKGFRAKEIEELRLHIRKYNRQVKQYW